MDHAEFVSRTKEALQDQSGGRPEQAVVKLRALLENLEPAIKASVNDWHQQQALSLLADALDSAGRKEECRNMWRELIEFNRRQQRYWQRSLSSATEDFERWNDTDSPEVEN
jgi:hypothetical protein